MNDLQLAAAQLEPPDFMVAGLLTPGLVLLGGPSKGGKSILVDNLAHSLTAGEPFLGMEVPTPRNGLYITLEDTLYRIQKRGEGWYERHGVTPQGRLEYVEGWPMAEAGGLKKLEDAILDLDASFAIIDTLPKFQPNSGWYNESYPKFSAIAELGRKLGCAIIGVMHTNKSARMGGNHDPLDDLQGSKAIVAASDSILVLLPSVKERSQGVLFVTGKDIETQNLPLTWVDGAGWQRAGLPDTSAKKQLEIRDQILFLLLNEPKTKAQDIANWVGQPWDEIEGMLRGMRDKGSIIRSGRKYSLPADPDPETRTALDRIIRDRDQARAKAQRWAQAAQDRAAMKMAQQVAESEQAMVAQTVTTERDMAKKTWQGTPRIGFLQPVSAVRPPSAVSYYDQK